MMDSYVNVLFGDRKTFDDWGLKLENIQLSFPEPKTDLVDIPGMDGMLDLTEVNGPLRYSNRSIVLTFSRFAEYDEWHNLASAIAKELHGKQIKCILPDDRAYYYIGRFTLQTAKNDDVMADVIITGNVEPYKRDLLTSSEPWLWDPFSFVDGVIRNYSEIRVDGELAVTVIGSEFLSVPWITVSSAMTVEFEGVSYPMKAGKNQEYDILIKPGENILIFKGNGTVTITYRGGKL